MNPTTIKLISLCGQYFINAFVDRVAEFIESGYWKLQDELDEQEATQEATQEAKQKPTKGVTPRVVRVKKVAK